MADASQPKGTGFVNLSRILDANKNNKLGEVVGNTLKGRAEGVRSNLGAVTNEFEQKRQAGALDTGANRDAREQALNKIMGGDTAVADQTQKQFDTFRTGKYTGPMGLDETKSDILATKANQLQGDVRGLNTVSGRGALLRQTVGTPQYTQGQEKLDNQLLGQNQQGFAQARQQAQGIAKNVQEQRMAAQQVGQTEAAKARQFGQDTVGQLQSNTGNIVSDLEGRAKVANTQRPEIFKALIDAINAGDITPEQAKLLGVQEGVQTYGANINPNIKMSNIEANRSTVANEQDKARLEALAKLSGLNGIEAIDATQVGAYNPLDINQQGIQAEINQRKQRYNDLLKKKFLSVPLGTRDGNDPSADATYIDTRYSDPQIHNQERAIAKLPNESNEQWLDRILSYGTKDGYAESQYTDLTKAGTDPRLKYLQNLFNNTYQKTLK